ncbi:ThiF family adenylyltransferase [Streptosporangium sp. NPDC023825]|uniref:HesA/MoeB/ThiF family protein n=1 Tax=Streptosporangium sp. NPDC023825 TaxID=3154909 RepID=UPI003412DA01
MPEVTMPEVTGPEKTGPEKTGPETADRFARQRTIPGWDQERLTAATAVIVGVGALGNETAKNLALAGVGRLILCDPDTVSATNLSRTVLLGPGDVGSPKVTAAAGALRRLVPGLEVETRATDLVAGIGLGELADADVVVGCVDTIEARMRLLGRCALVGAPLLDGGTHPWGGEVRVRVSPEEACYACTLTAHQRGASDLPWSCSEPAGAGPETATIATTALVASWLTLAALRLLFGEPPPYRILSIDAIGGRTAPVAIRRDPGCPLHRPLSGPVERSSLDNRATVARFLDTLPPGADPVTWQAFPLPGRCPRCREESWETPRATPTGATEATAADATGTAPAGVAHPAPAGTPGRTTGAVADGAPATCGRCGAPVRGRSSEHLRDADPRAGLSELGVAPEEILIVGMPGGGFTCHRLR